MPSPSSPLQGRVALVTGVSRSIGIAATLAQRLHGLGATVVATGWVPHDVEMPWGEDPVTVLALRHRASTTWRTPSTPER